MTNERGRLSKLTAGLYNRVMDAIEGDIENDFPELFKTLFNLSASMNISGQKLDEYSNGKANDDMYAITFLDIFDDLRSLKEEIENNPQIGKANQEVIFGSIRQVARAFGTDHEIEKNEVVKELTRAGLDDRGVAG